MSGKLFVIGTPIGNMGDITLRALEVLGYVDILLCEDTRVSSKLINHYISEGKINRKPEYVVYNDYNEKAVYKDLAERIESGLTAGLVTDAGMPLISDPGYRVVRECLDRGVEVEVIPGPSSVSTALAKSGLGGKNYLFIGYLPKKAIKRTQLLSATCDLMNSIEDIRVVVFLTPHKAEKDIDELLMTLGDKRAVVLRELTKKFEARVESMLTEVQAKMKGKLGRGEIVIVLANP